jgi:toxin-antitoxin system PIN domain toxin
VDLCDSNVWLALALSTHAHHAAVREWFDAVPAPGSVVFCRATQQTFLRLLTNASVLSPYGNPPLTNRQAWEACQALLADDRIAFRSEEPAGVEALWRRFAVRGTASPKLWMDAYLAAFALSGGYRMVTTDAAFKQFAGLDLELLGERG